MLLTVSVNRYEVKEKKKEAFFNIYFKIIALQIILTKVIVHADPTHW